MLCEFTDAVEDVFEYFDESAAEREEPDPNETRQISLTLPAGSSRRMTLRLADGASPGRRDKHGTRRMADNLRARLSA